MPSRRRSLSIEAEQGEPRPPRSPLPTSPGRPGNRAGPHCAFFEAQAAGQSAMAAIGMLIQNTHGHPIVPASTPPTTGPAAVPMPADRSSLRPPRSLQRSRCRWKTGARVFGMMSAAPMRLDRTARDQRQELRAGAADSRGDRRRWRVRRSRCACGPGCRRGARPARWTPRSPAGTPHQPLGDRSPGGSGTLPLSATPDSARRSPVARTAGATPMGRNRTMDRAALTSSAGALSPPGSPRTRRRVGPPFDHAGT